MIQYDGFNREPFSKWISEGFNSAVEETRSAILKLGQMCEINAAFPSVIHLLVKYEDNLAEALIENVMSGGDFAARGLLIGMVLGACHGMEAIPEVWLSELKNYDQIIKFLERIDRLA